MPTNGKTVLAKVSKDEEGMALKTQVTELSRQFLELRKHIEQIKRGEMVIAGKELPAIDKTDLRLCFLTSLLYVP